MLLYIIHSNYDIWLYIYNLVHSWGNFKNAPWILQEGCGEIEPLSNKPVIPDTLLNLQPDRDPQGKNGRLGIYPLAHLYLTHRRGENCQRYVLLQ